MASNVGNIDRILRLVLGVVLIGLPFLTEFPIWENQIALYGAVVVGAVLVLTAAIRFCPLYRVIGCNTCKI